MALSIPVPVSQLIGSGSTITIEELTPAAPGKKPRKVILIGGGLPLRGQANWTGETRIITTWYPGNGIEGSQQVLGNQLAPTTFVGQWNRTRMGRAATIYRTDSGQDLGIVDPLELWAILDEIRQASQRLRVTWSVKGKELAGRGANAKDNPVDFSIVREGRMTSLKIDPERHTDVPWSISFAWVSSGGQQKSVASVRKDDDLVQATSAVEQGVLDLEDLVDARIVSLKKGVRLSSSHLTLGQLESMANAPLKAVNTAMNKLRNNVKQFQRAGALARKISSTPFALQNSVLDFARNTTSIANQTVDAFGRTPIEKMSNKTKVAAVARAARHFGRINDGMSRQSRQANELEYKLRESLVSGGNRGALSVRESSSTRAGELLAIHVCKTGDTPQRVSTKYFQNPDQAEAILRANRLPLHTPSFRAGLILVIPAVAGASRSA